MFSRDLLVYGLGPILGLAALTAPTADSLRFAVEDGTTLRKTFREDTSWSLVSMQQTVAGRDQDPGDAELSGRSARTVAVADEYLGVGDGRPTKLRRSFGTLSGESAVQIAVEGMSEDYEAAFESPLEDVQVLFVWNEEDEAYELKNEAGGADDDVLERLAEDLDLRSVVPTEKVSEGDTWRVELETAQLLFTPGGDVALAHESLPDGPYQLLDRPDVIGATMISLMDMAGEWSGELELTWSDTEETESGRVAVLKLELDGGYERDLSDAIDARIEELGVDSGRQDLSYLVESTAKGEGRLRWNLDAGRFEELALEVSQDLAISIEWEQDFGGGNMLPLTIEVELAATSTIEAEASAE